MQRVLREAAVGNLNGWKPGEQEAELATLVLSLVTQLPFGQLSQQPGAPAGGLPYMIKTWDATCSAAPLQHYLLVFSLSGLKTIEGDPNTRS